MFLGTKDPTERYSSCAVAAASSQSAFLYLGEFPPLGDPKKDPKTPYFRRNKKLKSPYLDTIFVQPLAKTY
jgi:hypothetical protein